ncbi:helix-turn-helix transcriptional regulator [Tenacibaculum finnmarkense]|uniref:Helix-turn-helix domain-containing protein n=1 Tax=Tenacibaculum finnmarkense genomovar finnmarkense TaxID=1458503 RepID=A0AAP1RE20_9FLAO|nr:helix-turn-helix transcriptional regulator [Tenacibaculum finnmarkense]MBE7651963.1 helix-turn-helix domain-containing protein [Tenacibaculum finnmarkense genomovar finnmarkense]MBE7694322.1 helix-turn-helix domain-containing protein [Tenacibaculum finnmarkense genomovar finnmarkense]MCD8409281.1 helix-turn-helix transcriptional regulator [Tenacibaculum finnmarkense genomovar ulcerans]MCD8426180.1 helix-turn-helix transcriptional regulator [Tenacibaculum finnmarkense genomovar finnmarkense]
MAIKDLNKKLNTLTSDNKSNWEDKAKNRLANKSWLKHSRKIAIKINTFLKTNNIKQKELAKLLDVSPQQISKIIKGRENLTLETISKIEDVLKIQLLELNKTQKTQINLHKDFSYTKSTFKTNSNYKMSSVKSKVITVDFSKNTELNKKVS